MVIRSESLAVEADEARFVKVYGRLSYATKRGSRARGYELNHAQTDTQQGDGPVPDRESARGLSARLSRAVSH
jgi:hypothetical protein